MQEPSEAKPKRREKRKMNLLYSIGQLLLVGGIAIAVLGGALMLLSRIPVLSKLGTLPGDIRIEGQGFTCFVPIASMILISVLLTIIFNVIVRLINRP